MKEKEESVSNYNKTRLEFQKEKKKQYLIKNSKTDKVEEKI